MLPLIVRPALLALAEVRPGTPEFNQYSYDRYLLWVWISLTTIAQINSWDSTPTPVTEARKYVL